MISPAVILSRGRQSLLSLFPATEWLKNYGFKLFGFDLVAGITLASFVLPESMAYATLAGLPPVFGIYCCLTGGLFFALFTSSMQVAVGPTSAISLMVGTTVATLSGGDPQRWAAIAALTALAVAFLCYLAYFLKLSSLISFISENVLLGFKAGAALSIASTQFFKLFGIESGGIDFFSRIETLIRNLPETNYYVLVFGLAVFAALMIGHKLFPGKPVSLVIVIASILVMSFTSWAQYGFHLTGEIQAGLPPFGRPSLRFRDVEGIFPLALGCFLMAYIETTSSARIFAQKYNYRVNPRQELLSLGAANISAAFANAYPVSGGLSQSTVNDKAGAKTPVTLVICSVVLGILLIFFTGLLKNLPEVVLAVIVIEAVFGLIKIKALKRLFILSKTEFSIAMIAVIAVLVFGLLQGILIAAISSIGFVLVRSKTPNVAVLGLIPGTNKFSDIERNPGNTEIRGVKIFRVESSILYYNEEHIYDTIRNHLKTETKKPGLVILDLSASPYVDVAGAEMLYLLSNELTAQESEFRIVEALGNVRDMLRKLGMEKIIGHISRRDSISQEVDEFLASEN